MREACGHNYYSYSSSFRGVVASKFYKNTESELSILREVGYCCRFYSDSQQTVIDRFHFLKTIAATSEGDNYRRTHRTPAIPRPPTVHSCNSSTLGCQPRPARTDKWPPNPTMSYSRSAARNWMRLRCVGGCGNSRRFGRRTDWVSRPVVHWRWSFST